MSIFPIPVELLPDTKKLDEMNKELSALMPKEFTGAVNLMVNPVAGVAAFSSLGLGVASHAFGVWMGAVAGAAEVSQRLFMPFFDETTPDDFRDKARTPVKRARVAADSLIADAKTLARDAAETTAKTVDAMVEDAEAGGSAGDAAPVEETKPGPVEERQAIPITKTARKASEPIEKTIETPSKPTARAIVETAADLMPEDFRRPTAMEKPEAPDDLKLISGIGPKLETVLNGLGVWTYGQVAAWSKEEIAWLDDYLGFKGRIGRDNWIEQAAGLANATKPAGKSAKNVR
jgi:NADH-quinone oxidoreductase subunit E